MLTNLFHKILPRRESPPRPVTVNDALMAMFCLGFYTGMSLLVIAQGIVEMAHVVHGGNEPTMTSGLTSALIGLGMASVGIWSTQRALKHLKAGLSSVRTPQID